MAYIGFDLDETLGRFSVAHTYSLLLQPHIVAYQGMWSGTYGTERYPEPIPLSPALEEKLNVTFQEFIGCLAEKELQNPPLGLIRPSMIDLVSRLQTLKEAGEVKAVVIYSNNGNLALLHLAAGILEKLANAPGFFCNFIHWFHPSRKWEVQQGKPGQAYKTLSVLKDAFYACPSVKNTDDIPNYKIYFFDDAVPPHSGLQMYLGKNYIQLEPYKYDAEFPPLDECFLRILKTSGLLETKDYLDYIGPIISNKKSLQGILQFIENDKKTFHKYKPNNTSLQVKTSQLFPKRVTKQNFTKSLVTLRSIQTKRNRGKTLNGKEENALKTAQAIVNAYEQQHPNTGGGHRKTRKQRRH